MGHRHRPSQISVWEGHRVGWRGDERGITGACAGEGDTAGVGAGGTRRGPQRWADAAAHVGEGVHVQGGVGGSQTFPFSVENKIGRRVGFKP